MRSLRISLACAPHGAIDIAMEDSEDWKMTWDIEDSLQVYERDKRRLVHQHLSDSLCSLTCERDRQRTAQHCCSETQSWILDELLCLLIHERVLGVRHMMHLRIPSYIFYIYTKSQNGENNLTFVIVTVFINHWSKLIDWPVSLYWR